MYVEHIVRLTKQKRPLFLLLQDSVLEVPTPCSWRKALALANFYGGFQPDPQQRPQAPAGSGGMQAWGHAQSPVVTPSIPVHLSVFWAEVRMWHSSQ